MKNVGNRILSVCRRLYNFYAGHKVFFFTFSAALIFICIYVLNHLTPLLADDYCYSFLLGTEDRLTNFGDIFKSLTAQYTNTGGRVVGHFFAQLFLMLDKSIFNIANSLIYVLFLFLIYFHINAYKKINVGLFIFVSFSVWYFTPAFGESVLWLTGACNYLWCSTFILLFLLPYRLYSANPERFKFNAVLTVLFSLFGIIAGCTNENTGGAMIVAVCLFFLYCKRNKIKIPMWSIFGFCTALTGYLFLMAAPGNYVRATTVENASAHGSLGGVLFRVMMIAKDLYVNMYFIFFIIMLLTIIYLYLNKEKNITTTLLTVGLYIIVSLSGVFCVILMPGSGIPQRAWFGAMAFMYIAVGLIFNALNKSKLELQIKRCFLVFLIIPLGIGYFEALADAVYINSFIAKRTEYVLDQKSKGILDVEVERITAKNEHNPRFTYDDIQNEGFYGNIAFCKYHNINSIRSVKEHLVEGKPYAGFNFSRYHISIPRVCKSCHTNPEPEE